MQKGRVYLTVVALVGGLLVHLVAAQTANPGSPPDLQWMVSQAQTIFLGVCHTAQSRWDEPTGMILTDYTFGVETYLKGDRGANITVTEPGGTLPEWNLAMTASHSPTFREGEEVVLFVWTSQQGTHRVLGAERGKYRVAFDPATNERMVQSTPLTAFLQRITSHLSSTQ